MVKQTIITMKQPELGQKIQEWRKAKGLTQEELVEKCNINVRTIQRIEAGEVTPRSYTIKAILEVLGVSQDELPAQEQLTEKSVPEGLSSWYRFSFVAGIIYLSLAIVESFFDVYLIVENVVLSSGLGFLYTFIKISVFVLFIMFILGFYRLGQFQSSALLKVMSIFLIVLTGMFIVEDIATYWLGVDLFSGLLFRSIISGIVYVLFATGFLQLSKSKGTIYIITGAVGLLAGISFMTIVFAIPGLMVLTVFELLLIVLLHKEYNLKKQDKGYSFLGKTQLFY
ncbi:helix-turn-helix domain-containing protein [Belliella sp. DSM 107340]|uniref:Helix-turn-helix domain-containing protein n=2 Tax=Belliella calami TaxID=2923436 RepID=A0ABS9UIG0_9BACT|nr:helix-turn-helix domain-containing protein [Belliella calami]